MIGGPGIEVEIDESKFGRRKHNRGRQVDGHWVFVGIESVWGVFSGGSATARRQHSSTIDCAIHSPWKHCFQLSATTGLAHQTVNHISGAHTQGVEAMWSSCKRMLGEERTMHSKHISPNLCGEEGSEALALFQIY